MALHGEAAIRDVDSAVAYDLQLATAPCGFGLSGAGVETGEGVVVAHVGRVEDDHHLLATGQSGAGVGGQYLPVGVGVGHVQAGVVAGAQRLNGNASGCRVRVPLRMPLGMLRCVFGHRGRLSGR